MTGVESLGLFNLMEGCFWVMLGILTLIAYYNVRAAYKNLALFATVTLLAFGVSDFMQVIYGSFLVPGMLWLFIWKIVNVGALIAVFVWYVWLRLRQ